MAMNTAMVIAGVATLFQAGVQILVASLAILQYFCIIDLLQEFPLLVFIKIVYFHNPSSCGLHVNIGEVVEGMPSQALVLLTQVPLTATRTFYINLASLGLSAVWLLTCFGILRGGAKKKESKPIRWPWLTVTVAICSLDIAAAVTYINDTFHTRTLTELVAYIGGVASATGNVEVDTTWVAWSMVLLYSRFVFFFLLNLALIVVVVIHVSKKRYLENTGVQVEAQTTTQDTGTGPATDMDAGSSSSSGGSATVAPRAAIPRPGLTHSFRKMKERIFGKNSPAARSAAHVEAGPDSSEVSPERSPRLQHVDAYKKRTVNFPENLLSQRLENLIAEQRRRLDAAVVDTGRTSPPRASQSLPQLAPTTQYAASRRGTAAELQGQLPWAYVPGAANHMRDQLPPDEDLPPVPLPDYTVIPAYRKASVHRGASSLSSMTQKRDDKPQIPRPPLTSLDVLY
ncbi:hypothetical protein O0L34_g2652 [Tuta absoluta]|nr:hypothetical protein O0L34_g2652 [Tuta absoluta]